MDIVGLAMTSEDMASLDDIYQDVATGSKVKRTSYVLQVLWRDMTSKYDLVGWVSL
jgi:hypothetical protein